MAYVPEDPELNSLAYVTTNAKIEFDIAPGDRLLRLEWMAFYGFRVSGGGFPIAEGWKETASNSVRLNLAAHESKVLLVRNTPRTGFLGRKRVVDAEYYLTEV